MADEGASRKINDSTSESCGSTDAARTETVRAISGHYATTGRGTMTHDSQPARRIAFRKWVYYAPRRIRSKLQRSAHVCRLFSKLAAPPRSIALECESRIIPSPDNGRIIVEIGVAEIPNRGEKRSYHSNPPPPPPPPRVNGHAMAILQTIGIRTIAEIALRLLVCPTIRTVG